MGDDEFHRVLLNRFQDLEASHAKLTEQLDVLKEEKEIEEVRRRKEGSLYGRILQSMRHAVYVTEASDGNIIYWNHSAESLFGWKDYEAVGQKATDLMIEEPNHASIKKIVGMLNTGQSWSGQFPFKKRSGEIFMGLVTKSLLYEDSELFGVITVSSDAAIFSSINSEKIRTYQDHAYSQPRERKFNMKKILTPQIVSVPQLSSSVSNLASKVFSRQNGEDDPSIECARTRSQGEPAVEISDSESQKESKQSFRLRMRKNSADGNTIKKEESILGFVQPSKIAAKVLEKLEKLQIGGNSNDVQEEFKSGAPYASAETQVSNTAVLDPNFTRLSRETSLTNHNNGMMNTLSDAELNSVSAIKRESTAESGTELHHESKDSHATKKDLFVASWLECREYSGMPNSGIPLTSLALEHEEKEELQPNNRNVNEALEAHASEPQNLQVTPSPKLLSSAESSGSLGSSHENLSSGDKELDLIVVDCGIPWEELQLYDEIGNGSFAVVYRGAWNGSDVAIKVYFASEVGETNLMDYKKEIAIMKRLRHPNVLLFMGAVYSPERPAIVTELLPRCQSPVSPIHRSNILSERPAIVTELLPRGSLFKTLHRNNHGLDLKRRLRMALDVARGVNYLHRRNPPIVHRDLKSSNLLVDRNWTVKVGDFGLSKWKNATYLTAKSGRGTPQWMAPEVLRNEPSNEKSDVYSFGVILWELLTESIPWTNLNALQVVGAVGFMDRRLDLPNNLDPRLSSVIHDCWKSDPESRPSFHDLIHIMADLIQTFPSVPIRRKLEA